ncbi:hypothetical protein LSTR_LSTR004443 [Laodelphax striatellus]|uniref:Aminoacyl-transfer RNA synthetases class-II family profile domain-containing protein n=1 Tax=Laodelphax striatellus TaxID=195883 RepID=A0A482X9N9_LAOST|nr:hypothetical protein LSTR_LSTR004443 [Laodelphax striatellus]
MKLTHALRRLHFHTVDGIFQPLIIHGSKDGFAKDGNLSCTSQKLMVSQGLIHQSQNGLFCLLPLGLRVVEKLIKIVDSYMEKLGAQKIMVPSLTDGNLWKKTGRLETAGQEIFKVLDRHEKMFVLAPTHEESLANLLATVPALSHRNLPLRLYQITNKYRDEMRPSVCSERNNGRRALS